MLPMRVRKLMGCDLRTLKKAMTAAALGLLAACQFAGNSGDAPPVAPSGSSIRIVQISPSTISPIRVGERVSLQVEVEYSLSVDSGVINLVVQASDNTGIAGETEVVTKGIGKLTLKAEFVVPDTRAVNVFTPLLAQGQPGTSTVDARTYKVVAK